MGAELQPVDVCVAGLERDVEALVAGLHGERADIGHVRLLHLPATTSERQVEATLRARHVTGGSGGYKLESPRLK